MDGKAEEEEDVEFQERNVDLLPSGRRDLERTAVTYLKREIPPLHSQIGTYVFVDRPCKLIVELPGHEGHNHTSYGNHTGDRNQEGPDGSP